MRGKALAGLLGLLVVLVASAEEMGLRDFNATQFSGLWYEIALASNLEPQTAPQLKKMGAVLVEREGPYLTLTSVSDHINRCVKETTQAVKGDAPGKFKFPKEPGNKDVTVVATDYRTYAIVNVAFQKGRTAHRVLKLYSEPLGALPSPRPAWPCGGHPQPGEGAGAASVALASHRHPQPKAPLPGRPGHATQRESHGPLPPGGLGARAVHGQRAAAPQGLDLRELAEELI
ncbi:epididymal-specific lipocalin-5-like isoform X3 [Phacochoerus africanus]|uniref:epididymal-specific lipocalin-5-like isoform X3 n=1 Tax=Phacochoerus africanus TaxID=41426 RepID=UPI001FD96605|nr:epididymal-specific lipocalin-5-like isoform X3 [Phacochoerus africanus]